MAKAHKGLDEVGEWSEIKLQILAKYATAFATILNANKLHPVYIDGFAGAGVHISKATKLAISGSPLKALEVKPKFESYYLIDLSGNRVDSLRDRIGERSDVKLFQGDCNELL